ncbi:MAG: twin-arginine translocation signal domain-containing protein, partial [Granulosicoccus sp.]
MGALSNLYDPDEILWTGCPCGLHATMYEHQAAMGNKSAKGRFYAAETTEQCADSVDTMQRSQLRDIETPAQQGDQLKWSSQEDVLANLAQSAIMKGIFGTDMNRRNFLRAVGSTTAAAAISSFLPVDKVLANIVEAKGPLEKKSLNVGFVPITCATPIIMASPLGFYER